MSLIFAIEIGWVLPSLKKVVLMFLSSHHLNNDPVI